MDIIVLVLVVFLVWYLIRGVFGYVPTIPTQAQPQPQYRYMNNIGFNHILTFILLMLLLLWLFGGIGTGVYHGHRIFIQ
jgi:amino acid transporter